MYKYNIYNFVWYDSSSSTTSNMICVKTTFHVTSHLGENVQSLLQCDEVVIRELCESRDSCCDDLMFDRSELRVM